MHAQTLSLMRVYTIIMPYAITEMTRTMMTGKSLGFFLKEMEVFEGCMIRPIEAVITMHRRVGLMGLIRMLPFHFAWFLNELIFFGWPSL